MTDAEVFEEYRGLMFAVAYRMLGTVADAEDAVQDAWLRWSVASRADVADPRAYLVRIITNTALNRLRAVRARREAYIGPWLPEPLLTEAGPDAAERAELAESVSVAMLVVLESLTPDERAVFVLHEVFGFNHAEVAVALGRSAPAVRQLAHRAREHVQARRPRFDVDWNQQREVTARFLAAAAWRGYRGSDDGTRAGRHTAHRRRQARLAPRCARSSGPARWRGGSWASSPGRTWAARSLT